VRVELQPIFGSESFHGNLQMNLALAEQHHLMQLGVLLENERGILLAQFRNRRGQLHFVLAVCGSDSEPINGRQRFALDLQLGAAFGSGQRFARDNVFEPAQCHRIAGTRVSELDLRVATKGKQPADTRIRAVLAIKHRAVLHMSG
jgi:hypothetical protein